MGLTVLLIAMQSLKGFAIGAQHPIGSLARVERAACPCRLDQ
jgi:hypothetical protein